MKSSVDTSSKSDLSFPNGINEDGIIKIGFSSDLSTVSIANALPGAV